jgi:hypothetical protein
VFPAGDATLGVVDFSIFPHLDNPDLRTRGSRIPGDEVLADPRRQHHASGAQADPERVVERRQEVGEAGRPEPVAEVRGIAALDEKRVRLAQERNPARLVEAGQRGQLEHAHRRPAERDERRARLPAAAHPNCAKAQNSSFLRAN